MGADCLRLNDRSEGRGGEQGPRHDAPGAEEFVHGERGRAGRAGKEWCDCELVRTCSGGLWGGRRAGGRRAGAGAARREEY